MRILVVDDSPHALNMLSRMVEKLGHAARTATSAAEALEKVRDEQFDIVLIDHKVGEMDAVELCWHLRSAQGSRHIYLMVMLPGSVTGHFVEVIEGGADEFMRKPIDEAWLRARLLAAWRVVQMQGELQRLATIDGLTGAVNRRHFFERAAEEVIRARRYNRALSVQMVDIDHFKRINDTYGHAAGDEAIRSLVRSIKTLVRQCDVVGRLGGEEFALLLPETPLAGGALVAERLRRFLTVTAVTGPAGNTFTFTASIGVSELHQSETGIDAVLARADEALYRAKRNGRNRVETQPAPALPPASSAAVEEPEDASTAV